MKLDVRSLPPVDALLEGLPDEERNNVSSAIADLCGLLQSDAEEFFRQARQPQGSLLPNGLSSSLYEFRITDDLRLLATVEEDPLFDRLRFTLFHIVDRRHSTTVLKTLREALFSEFSNGSTGKSKLKNGAA